MIAGLLIWLFVVIFGLSFLGLVLDFCIDGVFCKILIIAISLRW